MTYAKAGVDIAMGDEVVRQIAGYVRQTHGPRVLGKHGGFAGCFRLDYNEKLFRRNYREPVLFACTDSVGSKVLLASRVGRYDTVGQDCVAMNVNDLIVQGAEPLFFVDYIGIHQDVPQRVAEIVKGVADGCQIAGCALISGETATLPDLYDTDEFDLVGFAVGVCELHRVIEGSRIEPADVILGLAASGAHSNGFSLIRAIIRQKRLDLDRVYPQVDQQQSLGQVLLTPTRIYSKPIMSVLARYHVKRPVRSMAHITGGGLANNVNRVLGAHLNAKIDCRQWQVPPVFGFIQQQGDVAVDEMFRVFNMGIGYVLIVRPHFAESIRDQLRRAGQQVAVLGRIVRGTGRVVLDL